MEIGEKWLRIYGVITPISPYGTFTKCEPVFVDAYTYEKPYQYYHYKKSVIDGKEVICGIETINVKKYGSPIFLPANHKKVNDGKEYFVIFQKTKCPEMGLWHILSTVDKALSVGILFPKTFYTVFCNNELSTEELISLFSYGNYNVIFQSSS